MSRRHQNPTTLLGEAFELKESGGWAAVQDNIQIQRRIERGRRGVLLLVFLAVMIATAAIVIVMYLV